MIIGNMIYCSAIDFGHVSTLFWIVDIKSTPENNYQQTGGGY